MYASTTLLLRDMRVAAEIAASGDEARTLGSAASRLFPEDRVEALYEMAFLRVFIAWEAFLEDSFIRCICGRLPLPVGVALVFPPFGTADAAEEAILGGASFFPWADPIRVRELAKKFVVSTPPTTGGGPHQQVLSSNISRLKALKGIRNYIAHKSDKARSEFEYSARVVSGVSYLGRSPGKLLRDKSASPVLETRLQEFMEELGNLARQIAI